MSKKLVIGINGDFRPSRKEQVALSWFNTGYYDSNGELRTSYNLSEDKWVWITYPTDTNLDLLK